MVGATLRRLDPATVAGRSPTRPCASGGRAPLREAAPWGRPVTGCTGRARSPVPQRREPHSKVTSRFPGMSQLFTLYYGL